MVVWGVKRRVVGGVGGGSADTLLIFITCIKKQHTTKNILGCPCQYLHCVCEWVNLSLDCWPV